MINAKRWMFGMLMFVLVPLEIGCAYLAFETLGEVTSMLYFLATGINLIFILVAIRHPTAAAVSALILGLLVIPYQLVLGDRLIRVQAEAARIVAFAYEERLDEGEFPVDLAGYTFQDPAMQEYVQSYRLDESVGGFSLNYRVGTESTSHSYTPEYSWSYYPD